MDVLVGDTAFARFVAAHLGDDDFTLIDVGCSGGLTAGWRAFGDRLRAVGFDADPAECARLAATEPSAKVRYVAGLVGSPPDHRFLRARAGRPALPGNPWARLSAARSVQIRQAATPANVAAGSASPLEPPAAIVLPDFLAAIGFDDVDFIKIDVDGDDLAILHTLDDTLAKAGVLGVGLEVNFFGTDDATDHSFHNTDRFMRQAGYDLFGLTVRRYSMAALPSRSKFPFPAETEFGRPLQGDALYVRDVCAPGGPGGWSAAKLAKAAALFALGDLPDCAAEVLATHGPALSSLFNVQQGLDLLAQSVRRPGMLDNYAGLRARFERDDPCFYTSPPPIIEASGTAVSDARVAVLERELAALRGSTSWRLTAPLRGLMRALRGGP